MSLRLVLHPLVDDLLATLRLESTPTHEFREAAWRISVLTLIEATRNLSTVESRIKTPVESALVRKVSQYPVIIPILRAGLIMAEAAERFFPGCVVGHVGLRRDEKTAEPHEYLLRLPDLTRREALIVDPMLATGGSACRAIHEVRAAGCTRITLATIVAAPEGIARVEAEYPEVEVVTCAVDERLNGQKFIVPGLGDFGDRLYGC